jgi:hypothetical protein
VIARPTVTLGLLLALAVACGTIAPPVGSAAPVNVCQTSADCQGYAQTGTPPDCEAGRCVLVQSVGNWTAVISLAETAPYGGVFGLGYSALLNAPLTAATTTNPDCRPFVCAQLPQLVTNDEPGLNLVGDLECTPSAEVAADYFLGDATRVAMPVQATFIPKWSTGNVDATSLGLPLPPLISDTIKNPGLEPTPGPGGGSGMEFFVAGGLPPLVYERVLTPLAPFDQAYPPDVAIVDLTGAPLPSEDPVWTGFDSTIGTSPNGTATLPTFEFNRADGGSIEGWTAYLRDVVTLRPFSQIAQLHGTNQTAKLITSHHPAAVGSLPPDALTGAQLVLVPAPGTSLPTWIYTPVNGSLADNGTFPKLPAPVSVQVSVVDVDARPTPADLIFEAIDICRYPSGSSIPVHDVLSADHDFAFVQRATAAAGSAPVTLPLGAYRVTAIPRSGRAALTIVNPFKLADPSCNPIPQSQLSKVQLLATSLVEGTAVVADRRPLSAATVEFVPIKCADGEVDTSCLPREGRTVTTTAGAFSMPLDPGGYLLRVRPAEGSGLPWVVQPLNVTPTPTTTAPVTTVPAPIYAGLQLFDFKGNPAAGALVQVFQNPASGSPYQIGEALTDSTGHFDMYLDAAAQ